jgi:hypothetical protein
MILLKKWAERLSTVVQCRGHTREETSKLELLPAPKNKHENDVPGGTYQFSN